MKNWFFNYKGEKWELVYHGRTYAPTVISRHRHMGLSEAVGEDLLPLSWKPVLYWWAKHQGYAEMTLDEFLARTGS